MENINSEEIISNEENTTLDVAKINILNDLNTFMDDFLMNELRIDDAFNDENLMSQEKANYFINLCTRFRTEINDINQLCDEEIERYKNGVNQFRRKRANELENQISYLESILYKYLISETNNKKDKKIKLPAGTLSIKKKTNKYIYDESKLLEFIKENAPNYINNKVVYSVNKNELKKSIQTSNGKALINGKEIEGIEIIEQQEKLVIK